MRDEEAYTRINNQRRETGQAQFDGIDSWRAAGSPPPESPKFFAHMVVLSTPSSQPIEKALEEVRRLDFGVFTVAFAQHGLGYDDRRKFEVVSSADRGAWVAVMTLVPPL
jgi:hypothetical protein